MNMTCLRSGALVHLRYATYGGEPYAVCEMLPAPRSRFLFLEGDTTTVPATCLRCLRYVGTAPAPEVQ